VLVVLGPVTDSGAHLQALQPVEGAECHVREFRRATGGKRPARTSIARLFEGTGYTTAILEFLATTEVGLRGSVRAEDSGARGPGEGRRVRAGRGRARERKKNGPKEGPDYDVTKFRCNFALCLRGQTGG
jgi:hypothetical protein